MSDTTATTATATTATAEKMTELDAAGVALRLFSPSFLTHARKWDLTGAMEVEGVKLEIAVEGDSLAEAVEELYSKWLTATRGLPRHGLRQIEHREGEGASAPDGFVSAQEVQRLSGMTPRVTIRENETTIDWSKELNDEIPF